MELNIPSQRNKRKFVDDDSFVYVLNNTNKDGSVEYWTCKKKGFCRAKIHVSNDRVVRAVGDHTHEHDVNAVQASVVINDIKREAETSQDCSLWKFIDQLKKEEALQHFSLVQVMSGASVQRCKKYRTFNTRI
jgi:FLYWCH zinc finger domain